MKTETKQRILILGGGFGGIYAAMHLEKLFSKDPLVEITLINEDNFLLFTPMLYEVASCDLDVTHIVNPIRKLLRQAKFIQGEVRKIELGSKTVTVAHGCDHHLHEIRYDQLVISLGSVTNFYDMPSLSANALTMKSLGDAIHLRNQVIGNFEDADAESENGQGLLTFVVAGGGFAGTETMAAINDFAREILKFYPSLSEDRLRMVLVHPGEVILPELGATLGLYAQEKLQQRKVEILVNTKVTNAGPGWVDLSDGTHLETNTLVWTAGTMANPLLADLGCPTERGRLIVNEFMEVQSYPGVWALGDCACAQDPKTGKPYPPTAQHAIRQAKTIAVNIGAAIRGGSKQPFRFNTIGLLAAIGKRTGVAQVFGVNFSGFLAWAMWRTIYLSKLPRFEKKVRVALDWTLDLVFSKDIVKFMTMRSSILSHEVAELLEPALPVEPSADAI